MQPLACSIDIMPAAITVVASGVPGFFAFGYYYYWNLQKKVNCDLRVDK